MFLGFFRKEQVSPDDEVKLHPESRILLPSPVSEPTVVKCLPVTTASLPSPLQSPPPEIKPEDDSKASLVNGEPESTFKLPIALSEPSTASPTPVKQSTKAASRSRRHSASKQEEAETQHSCSSSSTSRQQASGSQTPNVEHCPETPFKNSRSRRSAISLSSEEIGDNRPIQAPRSSTSQNQKVDAEPQRKMKKDEDEGAVKPQRVRLPKKLAIDAISRRPKRGQSSEASTPNKRRRSQNKIDPDSHLSSFKRGRSSKSPHQPTSLRRSRSQKSLTDVGVDKKNQSRPEKQNHEKTVLPGPALKSKGRQTGVSPALSQRRRRPSTTAAEPPKKRTRASTTLALSRSSNRRR
ncbi:unnamed protein product [Mesocestoides corti]|uniref:Serine/arginine repetitive matrix protein 2-like n=1 Tax=Mesocestoides corti TaxID=53468 RepID=A0A0R3UAZ3_MESCO|nr:unnamed protein product [Mesocestoides corti]